MPAVIDGPVKARLVSIDASYAVPLKKFTGKSSIIELGFSSTSEEETDNEDVVVGAYRTLTIRF